MKENIKHNITDISNKRLQLIIRNDFDNNKTWKQAFHAL